MNRYVREKGLAARAVEEPAHPEQARAVVGVDRQGPVATPEKF